MAKQPKLTAQDQMRIGGIHSQDARVNSMNSAIQKKQSEAFSQIDDQKVKKLEEYVAKLKEQGIQQERIKALEKEYRKYVEDEAAMRRQMVEDYLKQKTYEDALLADKVKIKQAIIAEEQAEVNKYQAIIDGEHTTQAQREAAIQSQLQHQQRLNDAKAQEKNMQDAINKAEMQNSTIQERMAKLQRDRIAKDNKAFEAIKNADARINAGEDKDQVNAELGEQLGEILGAEGPVGDLITQALGKMGGWVGAILKVLKTIQGINQALNTGVTNAMNLMSNYLGKIDSRLQGTETTYETITSFVSDNFGANPYISQQKLIENVAKLTEAGIAYNLEERAVIETLKDRMVSTFDTLDASLTRLIRIQQADTTFSQMGIEAQLTQFLNSMFSDTSYLSSDGMYDSVYQAVIDANSQLDVDESTKYNFAIQKWLGSLYEVGLSSDAVGTIAKGINLLSTGDVAGLSSNSQLQTLLALTATRAGYSYSSLLTNGMTADNVNNFMKAMVELLQDIDSNTSNQVTKSQWGDVLNLEMADWRAISNLTSSDIATIYAANTSYEQAVNETMYQLGEVGARTSPAEKLSNLIDNALLTFGNNLINDTISVVGFDTGINKYYGWALGEMLGGLAGTALQTAVGAGSAWDTFKDIFTTFMDGWDISEVVSGYQPYTTRGEGFVSKVTGGTVQTSTTANASTGIVSTGTSMSGYFSNEDVADITTATLAQQAETVSLASAAVTGGTTSTVRDVSDIYTELFDKRTTVRVQIAKYEDLPLEQLRTALNIEEDTRGINNIEATMSYPIRVDLVDNDVNSILNNVYGVRLKL